MDMSTLVPHGACLLWKPELIWLNAISDALVTSAFFTTAFVLAFFAWRRGRDMMFAFRGGFWVLAIFFTVCGVTRLQSILTLWVPAYGIEGLTKGLLALISVGITGGLLLLLPRIMVMSTRVQLQQAYAALEEEVRLRRSAEAMVQRFQEIEATESQVRQAQKMEAIGQLTGGVAHDFNNILTVITGTIEILSEAVKDRPHLAQITNLIGAAAARGADLTKHLLAFSRRRPRQPRNVDVNAVVVDAARLLRPTLGEQIEIESMLAHDSAPALIDPSQLTNAILNLALNARDAMPNGGKLTLETKNVVLDENYASMYREVTPGNYVMIAVSDSGKGIPASQIEKVFDPFFTTKDVGVGSGLGLSLVHGIVANVGGAIDVATELGKGSTFTVYLPRSGDAPAKVADENRPLQRGAGQRVLVVDDEEPLVRLASETLERLGYAPVSFTSSTAALAAFRANPQRFDAVLTDERMPGLSGSALIREVRGIRDAIPVVLMSGYLGMDNVDANVVVKKPLSARDLATSMARALER